MIIEDGLKFNWTVKEKALKNLEYEQKEKESIIKTKEVFASLGIEILK